MTNRIQTLRSSLTGNRPAAGTRQPGELYVNFADNQIGVVNAGQNATDLVAVRFFSASANYAVGDHVIQGGYLYRALSTITAGAFNPIQWVQITVSDLSGYLPLAGGTMTGALTLAADPVSAMQAVTQQYVLAHAGSGLVDAPSDGSIYGRLNGAWAKAAPLSSPVGGDVNRFRNAAMDIWQHGNSITVAANGYVYTADGWKVYSGGATSTVALTAGLKSTVNALRLTGNTSVSGSGITQPIESYIAAALAGQTVTFQARIQNNTGAAITPTLRTWVPTGVDSFGTTYNSNASLTADLAAVNLQTIASGATVVVSYTFNVSVNAIRGYRVDIDFGGTLNANTKNVVISELDIRATPGLTVGLSTSPSPPELRLVGPELLLCQRYYFNSGTAYPNSWNGSCTSGQSYFVTYPFPVPMRAGNFTLNTNCKFTDVGISSSFSSTTGTLVNGSPYNLVEGRTANATNTNGSFGSAIWASQEL